MSTLLNTVSGARGVDALVSLTMQCESPGSSAHMQAAFTSYSACLLCRADNGGATAEAAPPTREYIFLCGEVLDDETGTERVLTPSEPRRAVWDADEVASALVEAEQASAALPAASVQQQQQQQWPQPLHEASAAQPQDASAAHAPGVQQQASFLLQRAPSAPTPAAAAAEQDATADSPTTAASSVSASASAAAPTAESLSMPQVT